MKNSVTIAKACFEAYVHKDRAAIELLINDEFHFTSPLDNRIDRKTYFERCWPNSQHIVEFKFMHVVPFEDKVVVVYEGSSSNGEIFRNTDSYSPRGCFKPCQCCLCSIVHNSGSTRAQANCLQFLL